MTLNIPCWISRKMIIFARYFQNVMVSIILPTIMKNGSVVDSVHINTLLSFVGRKGEKLLNPVSKPTILYHHLYLNIPIELFDGY